MYKFNMLVVIFLFFLQDLLSQRIFDVSHTFSWNYKNITISINGSLSVIVVSPEDDRNVGIETPVRGLRFDKIYSCTMDTGYVIQEQLLSSHRAWTFPRQDTNLTLTYPSTQLHPRRYPPHLDDEYRVITSYRVELFQDSSFSQGFVTSGGLLRDHITLDLLSRGVSNLAYEFEVYGMKPRDLSQEMVDSVKCS